jgi:hypothetical protein
MHTSLQTVLGVDDFELLSELPIVGMESIELAQCREADEVLVSVASRPDVSRMNEDAYAFRH